MCGIVGYIGKKNPLEVVLEGLKRLEYRGYDSAGVSFKQNKGFKTEKKAGKLENLLDHLGSAEKQKNSLCIGALCIGHTRWATHGEVSDINAHPHCNDEISLVHNGIIENFESLKNDLKADGFSFSSDTDSEVFLNLVSRYYRLNKNLADAVSKAFGQVEGNSAFVVVTKDKQEMVAIKRGAPLVCGHSEDLNNILVSSDPYALVGHAEILQFPEDEVLCLMSPTGIQFQELDGSPSKRYFTQQQRANIEVLDKGHYEHFMLKEIFEQPQVIRQFLTYYMDGEGRHELENMQDINGTRLHITACGTAWHAGLVIRNLVEKYNGIPTDVELASEFRYRNPIIRKEELAVFISQSGETADTLAAQELCMSQGLKTIGLVNVQGSSLYRSCDKNLLIKAGVEIGVASTKAFTQQVLTGFLTSRIIKGELDKPSVKKEVLLLADRIEELLSRSDEIKRVAGEIYNNKGFLFTGRGIYHPIALEGALKLKEIAYVHAEGYASGELKHGPIALIDKKMVNIAIVGPELLDKTISNIEEVKARKGVIVGIGPKNHRHLERISDYYIPLNFEGFKELSPLYVNVVTQLLAYHMAKFKGTDIDKPRNLAKSVTVE